jgi:hypothetical protein
MDRIFLLLIASALVGCAQVPRQPIDVTLVPNDCANREAITRWLEQVARHPKSPLQSQQDYEQHQSTVKARLWSLRYRCQPV